MVDKLEKVFYPHFTGIYKQIAIIIITHISHNISHKFNTPFAQFKTTIEVLNNTRKAINSTQLKTYRIYEDTRNNKILNYQNSLLRNAIFTALCHRDQLTL